MSNVVERVVVQFAGAGAGSGELSWGQLENWSAIVRLESWLPLGGVSPLPPGTTVADVADQLRYAMSRYASMRTRLVVPPVGRPRQIVAGSGEITLAVIDAGNDDPASVAAEVSAGYERTPLDFTTDWPIRMAIIRQGPKPTHLVALISHFVTDAVGAMVMTTEVAARESQPVGGTAPLEQARWQRSPNGRRQNDAALRHWERILRGIAPRRFPAIQDPVAPRYWRGEFTSPAMTSAVRAIGVRTGADPTGIRLAAFALALTQTTGINPVVVRPLVSNRFRPGLSGVVCTATQAGICLLDVAGLSFTDTLDVVRRAALSAYKYAYFNVDDVAALIARVSAERGTALELGCFINDRSGEAPAGAVVERTAPSGFRWLIRRDHPAFEPMILDLEEVDSATRMTIHFDTHSIAPSDAEALLRAMEATLVAAAPDPSVAAIR